MTNQPEPGRGVWRALPWSLRYAAAAGACVLIVVAVLYLLLRLAVLVVPLTLAVVVALLLTALLQPVTEVVCRRGLPRAVGATAGILVLLAVLVLPGVLLWSTVADQAAQLPRQLAEGWARTREWVGGLGLSNAQIDAMIQQATEQIRAAAPSVTTSAATAAEVLGATLLTVILVFFLLKDGPAMATWGRGLLPEPSRGRWADAAVDGWHTLARYARGTVAVAAIDAIGIGIALFAIGVPLALPLALLTFVAAFVPILGATVAGAVATLIALAAGGPTDALLVLAAVIVVQQVEGNLLEPLIMGRALRLHPAVVLVAVTTGALTGGVAGALVSVPLTAVTYQVVRTVLGERLHGRPVAAGAAVADSAADGPDVPDRPAPPRDAR